jgi:hypothetical protein
MWRSNATQAVPASLRDGSTCDTGEKAGTPGTLAVRLVQLPPSSFDSCRLPSSVPAQSNPFCAGDSAKLMIVQWFSAVVFSFHTGPPASFCFSLSLVVRSGLIVCQVSPKSRLRKTTLPAK